MMSQRNLLKVPVFHENFADGKIPAATVLEGGHPAIVLDGVSF